MTDKPKYNPANHHRRSIRLKGYDYSQAGAYFITVCTHNRLPLFGEIVRVGFTPALDNESPNTGVGAGFTPAPDDKMTNIGVGASSSPTGISTGKNVGSGFTHVQMNLNEYGQIAHDQWQKISERFDHIELGEFVIMPNHIHGIIVINESQTVEAGFTPAPNDKMTNIGVGASPSPTILRTGQPQGLPLRKTIGDIVGAYKSLVANECLKIFKSKNETMGKLWQRNYYEHIIRNEKSYLKIAQYILDNPAKWQQDSLNPGGNS